MKTYPNQNIIIINQLPRDKNNFYGMFNKAALTKARRELGGSAFKIWTYINENANGYKFALSQIDVQEKTDVKKSAYYTAREELISKGFLVEIEGSNVLQFFENGASPENGKSNTAPVQKTENVAKDFPENGNKAEMRTPNKKLADSTVQKSIQDIPEKEPNIPEKELNVPETNREILQDTIETKYTYIQDDEFQNLEIQPQWQEYNPYPSLSLTSEQKVVRALPLMAGKQSLTELNSSVSQLLEKGKSYEWILAAIDSNTFANWQKYGFGSAFNGMAAIAADKKMSHKPVAAAIPAAAEPLKPIVVTLPMAVAKTKTSNVNELNDVFAD